MDDYEVGEIIIPAYAKKNNKILLKIPTGFLVVTIADVRDYPGVYISYSDKEDGYEQDICLVEQTENDKDSVKVYLWEDETTDDFTREYSVKNYKEEEEE